MKLEELIFYFVTNRRFFKKPISIGPRKTKILVRDLNFLVKNIFSIFFEKNEKKFILEYRF